MTNGLRPHKRPRSAQRIGIAMTLLAFLAAAIAAVANLYESVEAKQRVAVVETDRPIG